MRFALEEIERREVRHVLPSRDSPMQKCLSLPPWSGLSLRSVGSGLGSSIRWIISGPIQSQAPRYGSLSSGLSGLIGRPRTSW